VFKDGDTLWHLGDVYTGNEENAEQRLKDMKLAFPNSKFFLVRGNYDEGKDAILDKYFDEIYEEAFIANAQDGNLIYLNHYPTKCRDKMKEDPNIAFSITGHIHGLWKVQPKMINVGVDAWHFRPVSEEEILFCWGAMQYHYDGDVYPYIANTQKG
jgi:calcineurin-like phosphoesterase family protein